MTLPNHNGAVPTLPKGHNLKGLYNQLRSDIQTAIMHLTVVDYSQKLTSSAYTNEMFESDLQKYSNAFEQSRYWYEQLETVSTKEAGIQFMSSLAKALTFLVSTIEENQNRTK